jgi:hypothetical protein
LFANGELEAPLGRIGILHYNFDHLLDARDIIAHGNVDRSRWVVQGKPVWHVLQFWPP